MHRTVTDAELFEVLFKLEEIVPISAELAGRPSDALSYRLFGKLAGVVRMGSVRDERDRPHHPDLHPHLHPTWLVGAAEHLAHPHDAKLGFHVRCRDPVGDAVT